MVEFFIIVVIVLFIFGAIASSGARSQAKTVYQASLKQLSQDPTNPELRQKTLELGRRYSNLTRNNKGVSLFDEVALMNDINAACGGTTAIAKPGSPSKATAKPGNFTRPTVNVEMSLQDRLMRLSQLKEQGLVNDEEYQAERQQLLNEV